VQEKKEKLVIVGDSPIAEVAYEYFTCDSPYEVVAFSVESDFLKRDRLFDLPVVPFETVEETHRPSDHRMFVALGFAQMNRVRARLYERAREKGFSLASYVSSRAFVWRNALIGENCFILENNVIQPFVSIGNNVTLWSGNHIGHHSTIRDHCFVASHVVVSGFVEVGEYCFLGVNATIANNVTIGKNCLIGAGAAILKDTDEAKIYATRMTPPKEISVWERFGIEEGCQ